MKVGIDLGTTNSVVAHLDEDGDPEVIKNSGGDTKTPSVVQITEDETRVGDPAARNKLAMPDQTVERVKRHMGDDWSTEINGEEYGPEAISARILKKVIGDAEDQMGEDVEEAVITVPAYFGPNERAATMDAAQIAGLDEEQITLLNEPTAACLRYGIDRDSDEVVFVYDLGGGTFDATLVRITDDGGFQVEGVEGGQRLGGEDFDDELYDYVRGELLDAGHPDPEENRGFKHDVLSDVREVKHTLSEAESATLTVNIGAGEMFTLDITRDKFDELTDHLVEETFSHIDALFDHENVSLGRDDVDEVLLVGGSTRIPHVQERVEEYFGMEPSKSLEQDLVVAEGAALRTDIELESETGDEEGDGESTQGTEALPRDIGVAVKETDGDRLVFEEIMEQHTKVPNAEQKAGFKKYDPQSTEIEIEILEGGEPLAENNDLLGEFRLENLDAGSDPEFEIEFRIDGEGRLHAEATNLDTGQSADTTLELGLENIEEAETSLQREMPGEIARG
ncbi:MAG: Hsp70 family protein [Haloplanus sp.]